MHSQLFALGATFVAAFSQTSDDLFLAAFSSNSVSRHDLRTGQVTAILQPPELSGVLGAAVGPDGALYVCSESNDRVLKFDPASAGLIEAFIVDDPNTGLDETGGLDGPAGIVFGSDGRVYVASFNTDAILRYDARSGLFLDVFVPSNLGALNGPDAGMAFGPDGALYVPSYFTHRIKRYDGQSGAFLGDFMSFSDGLRNPRSVLFHSDGSVYVTSEGNDTVFRCDSVGGASCQALIVDDPSTSEDETGGLDGPTGIALGADGRLLIASLHSDAVLRYERSDGRFLTTLVESGAAGNDAPTYLLTRPAFSKYCQSAPNSAGAGALLKASGWTSVALNQFALQVSYAPPQTSALCYYGTSALELPFGDGWRCIGGPFTRLPLQQVDASGSLQTNIPLGQASSGGSITPGSTWYFQFWYRDPAAGGSGFNLSDALSATFGV